MSKVYGPYTRADGRQIVIVDGKTISYPKYLYQNATGRILTKDETIDHIDNNPNNNDLSNLRVLTRAENARRGSIGNTYCVGRKFSAFQKKIFEGENNSRSKISLDEVKSYRQQYEAGELSKMEIITKTGLCRRTVENFLNYRSYK